MAYNRLEKAAEASYHLSKPAAYDISVSEIQYLIDIVRGSPDERGIYRAITTAFAAGFTRGHRATARGRIPTKTHTVTRSK